MCDNMNDNPCYNSCVNRSPPRSPTRAQCSPMSCLDDLGAPAFKIEEQLNEVYEKRLAEINEQADGDARLKEITYQEWIDMLRQINKTLITNIQEMEHETSERLTLLQRKVSSSCRYGQDNELCKLRKDMAGLMQLVRNGRRNGDWSVDKFNFETITENDIFGNDTTCNQPAIKLENDCSKQTNATDPKLTCANQKSKLIANVKALAFEVADKHDEIRDLKKQILSMEDEIQKAQKKIQLKDDVIKELRNDLKSLPKCTSVWGARIADPTRPNLCLPLMSSESGGTEHSNASPVDSGGSHASYSNRDSINSLNCITDNISGLNIHDEEDEEEDFMKCLKEELNQFFEMRRCYDQNVDEQRRAIKEQQNRLSDMVDKLLKSNSDLQNKLRFYRRELLVLDNNPPSSRTITNCSDGDSGISSDADADVKILNTVRGRITSLMDENQRLRREEQCFQIKFEDVSCRAIAKSELLEKTSEALREVADALSNALCKPIAYDKIFGECPNMSDNPIVDAVDDLMEALKEKDKTIGELRKQVSSTGKINQELESNSEKLMVELSELKQSV